MATELAKAYVQIIPSAKGMKAGIENEMGTGGDVGQSYGSKLCGAIKNVIATAAIGKAIKDSVLAGADLQQAVGGVETLFKDSANTVIEYANQAFRTAGLSANDYMEQVTSFSASLLQSLGGDTAAAAESANQALIDMSDNANKFGTDMVDIQNAYQGFAKQNYTMLDNLKLGYGGTKKEMERLLKDAQKISGVKYDISNLNDVYSAIHVIQEDLDITGTTAKEASTTFSGSFASMKSAATNLLATLSLGDQATMSMSEAIRSLVSSTGTFLANLLPMLGNILSGLPDLIDEFLIVVTRGINIASYNSDAIIQQGAEIIGKLATGIIRNIPYIAEAALNLISSLGSAILNADWEGLARETIGNLKYGLDIASGEIFGSDENIINALKSAIQTGLPNILQSGVDIATNIANGILQNIPTIISMGGTLISSFVESAMQMYPSVWESGCQLLLNLVNGIVNNLPQIVTAALSMLAKLLSTIGSNLPKLLQSGIEMTGKLAAGLIRAIPTLVSKIPQIITSIVKAFLSVDWGNIGINIIKGIASGIASAAGQLWDAAKDVLGGFKDKVLDFFGIHSPATWGIYVGKMISLGLPIGVEENVDPFRNSMQKIGEAASSPIEDTLAYNNARLQYTNAATTAPNENSTIDKLDKLIELISMLVSNGDKELKISIGDREFIRVLRDLGVTFA